VYGQRWKELYKLEVKRRAELEAELRDARARLEADMEIAYEDYKTQLMREDLQRRQKELERLEDQRRERLSRAMGGGIIGNPMMQQSGGGGGGGQPFGTYGAPPMHGGHMGLEPSIVDGPLGRGAPPTFGSGGGE